MMEEREKPLNRFDDVPIAEQSDAYSNLAGTLKVSPNFGWFGPATGTVKAVPTFRALVAADVPGIVQWLCFAVGDETTAITTGTAKLTFRLPACTVLAVRSSLTTASSSGIPTVDINETGVTIISTKLTIDATEKTSTTAATAPVISDSAIADDAEMTIDIDVAGTGAAGLKVYMQVRWTN